MKCYRTDGQLRLVGKAWEIRRYLREAAALDLKLLIARQSGAE